MKNLKSFNESNREFYEKIDISWKDIEVIKSSPYKNTVYECVFTDSEISLRPISLMSFSVIASKFNRIHTSYPLSSEYRGIGLGYKCYKSVINEVGYVSSDEEGTNIYSRNVWKHLIKDKDYYSFEIKKACDYISESNYTDGFFIFKKTLDRKKIGKVLNEFKKSGGEIITMDPNF